MKTYAGTCHCKAVRFEVDIEDLEKVSRCNCTFCTKRGQLGAIVEPSKFRLVAGESELSSYEFGMKVGTHRTCKTCGIYCFTKGHLAELGGDYVGFNVNCLDEVDPGVLRPVYWDGRHDNWEAGPRVAPWPIFA
jgi:hypothetical protein